MTAKSWIATAILAPLLVGLILLLVQYQFFDKSPSTTDSVLEKAKEVVKQIEPIKETEESYIEPNLGNLQTLVEIADKIYGTTERNAEYVKIIDLALNEDKPGFAFSVAQKIYGTTERNAQCVNTIDNCLVLKKYTLSIKVADNIYGTTERNKQYKKILKAGTKERENSTSNKANSADAKSRAAD